jgi:hypothetical protein
MKFHGVVNIQWPFLDTFQWAKMGKFEWAITVYLPNYITMLKYNLRGPVRRVQEFLMVNNNLDLSIKGINDALLRVGDTCRSEYARIQDQIFYP